MGRRRIAWSRMTSSRRRIQNPRGHVRLCSRPRDERRSASGMPNGVADREAPEPAEEADGQPQQVALGHLGVIFAPHRLSSPRSVVSRPSAARGRYAARAAGSVARSIRTVTAHTCSQAPLIGSRAADRRVGGPPRAEPPNTPPWSLAPSSLAPAATTRPCARAVRSERRARCRRFGAARMA
jgi:hypothetical protein